MAEAPRIKQAKHWDIHVRKHKIRIVLDTYPVGGMYGPRLAIHLFGPNGSSSGHGSKPWPRWLFRIFPGYWKGTLHIRPPQARWTFSGRHPHTWKIRNALHRADRRFYTWIVNHE
jgi:hypothetical protein